ncbi:MAG TPA: murein L,D-transpeptidase catalytic domain family protein, partial [Chlorobaculum parvum]|nr:murein L,D-transpeptidase catalytic domain family protein [Chlorobaculum parvum]
MHNAIRIITAVLLLLLSAITYLFYAPGHVNETAVSEAKAALANYLQAHPGEKPMALAVVDFSQPSYAKRMAIIDLRSGERTFYRVAHGRNSGEIYARRFSDIPDSNMSSLGLFRITKLYYGDHGLALKLAGLDSLRNGNAARRNIVLHEAGYVSIPYILLNVVTLHGPMTGRSNGCFAVSKYDI